MEKLQISVPKEMYNIKLKSKMVKIMMKRDQPGQTIKLLLENKGDLKTVTNFQSVSNEKDLQFYIPKSKLVLDPRTKGILEIKALHKLKCQETEGDKPEIIHMLVLGNVNDCELKFGITFEITIV